jgi:carboxymethylenebutenolidase
MNKLRLLLAFFLVFLIAAPSAYSQDWAQARLNKSKRHGEWVDIKAGPRTVKTFVVYPEVRTKAPSVVLIHEIFGLSDWVRSMADQLAAAGFIAVAPDLLSGTAPGGKGTEGYKSEDDVRKAVQGLPPAQITSDLNAVVDYATKLPANNGTAVIAGWCWGGGQAFRYATTDDNIEAAFVFYGPAPSEADIPNVQVPVYGFYAEHDARINATLDKTIAAMKKHKKKFDPVVYKGAGHAFMRQGEAPDAEPGNKAARALAWPRFVKLINEAAGTPASEGAPAKGSAPAKRKPTLSETYSKPPFRKAK